MKDTTTLFMELELRAIHIFRLMVTSSEFLKIIIAVPNDHEALFGGWSTAGINAALSIHPNLPVHSLRGERAGQLSVRYTNQYSGFYKKCRKEKPSNHAIPTTQSFLNF